MLTWLSIRFPDRVPKGDHDKILKDHFFYAIRSDIHNSIRHLYDDEMVTFSQLLVKVCQNEEEDNTSILINKSAVAESTLEHRVDKLIERSNGQFNTNPARVPWDDNCSYGRPLFQQYRRSKGELGANFHPTIHNIWQNLRGPEPSSAGSFEESDGSKPIKCFKCRGWGHPKCLCPSQGGVVQEPPSQTSGR